MEEPQVTPLEQVDVWANLRRDQQGRALCHAHSGRTGELCNAPAVRGMTVCRTHGGASKQAINKAKLRLAELVDPAIATLAREMATAETSADRQRAANSILDRAGWGRVTAIEGGDVRELLIARLLSMRDQALELDQVYEPEVLALDGEPAVIDAATDARL
jgi:hypothetical protein